MQLRRLELKQIIGMLQLHLRVVDRLPNTRDKDFVQQTMGFYSVNDQFESEKSLLYNATRLIQKQPIGTSLTPRIPTKNKSSNF